MAALLLAVTVSEDPFFAVGVVGAVAAITWCCGRQGLGAAGVLAGAGIWSLALALYAFIDGVIGELAEEQAACEADSVADELCGQVEFGGELLDRERLELVPALRVA